MKQPVYERVELEVGDCVGRRHATDHVVPLQDLVKEDPVEESSKPDAEHQRGTRETAARWRFTLNHDTPCGGYQTADPNYRLSLDVLPPLVAATARGSDRRRARPKL